MPKHRNIAKLLKGRITRGDYQLQQFPSTVKLAAELDINRRTVTKAMTELIADGLLIKTDTGRIMPTEHPRTGRRHLALIAPAFQTSTVSSRFAALEKLTQRRGWDIRLVSYTHVQESVLYEAAANFDGLFIVPLDDDFPQSVLAKLAANATKAVALIADLSMHGIPSLTFENNQFVGEMLDHLHAGGYRSIACVNTQPMGRVMRDRISQWQLWKSIKKVTGPLLDDPVEHFVNPMSHARDIFNRFLAPAPGIGPGPRDVDAVFCTTGSAAVGVMRAMADHGLVPGKHMAVCAADGHGMAEFLSPSLTSPADYNEDQYLDICLDYFAEKDASWVGPLVVQPRHIPIFIGQSSAPRRHARAQSRRTDLSRSSDDGRP